MSSWFQLHAEFPWLRRGFTPAVESSAVENVKTRLRAHGFVVYESGAPRTSSGTLSRQPLMLKALATRLESEEL